MVWIENLWENSEIGYLPIVSLHGSEWVYSRSGKQIVKYFIYLYT